MDEVLLGADRVADAGGSPSEQLTMLGAELLDVIHRYPDHVWVFLHEFPALTAERADQFRTRRREYERRIEAVLRAGIDAGEFRDVDPWLTARAWLGMHNYTYLWLKSGGAISATRRGEALRRHLPQGHRDRARRSRRLARLHQLRERSLRVHAAAVAVRRHRHAAAHRVSTNVSPVTATHSSAGGRSTCAVTSGLIMVTFAIGFSMPMTFAQSNAKVMNALDRCGSPATTGVSSLAQ